MGKPQGEPAWIVWCCVPDTYMMIVIMKTDYDDDGDGGQNDMIKASI